jgi:transmembrane sensor
MKIRVTGTKFNVTSYAGDQTTQAVLLSGKIDADKKQTVCPLSGTSAR